MPTRRISGTSIGTLVVDEAVLTNTTVARPSGYQKSDASPLLLVPLRLEYRVVETVRNVFVDTSSVSRALNRANRDNPGRSRRAENSRAVARNAVVGRAVSRALDTTIRQPTRREIWFRWYPDDGFSLDGIEPATTAELDALDKFSLATGGLDWFQTDDAVVAAAWQEFAAKVGSARGIHLIREQGDLDSENFEEQIGRIACLPTKISLFTIKNGEIELLADGKTIPQNSSTRRSDVAYFTDALSPGAWLNDFGVAVDQGMGIKIRAGDAVQQALAADNVIAVGMHSGDATDEISLLLQDGIANGEFAFIEQDTPTNNSPGNKAGFDSDDIDKLKALNAGTTFEQGRFSGDIRTAAALLASALGIDAAILQRAFNSDDTAFDDAQAMLRVIGPALLDGMLDGVTAVDGVDENEFIDVLTVAFCARGQFSAMRFGDNPFGLLPVTPLDELNTGHDDSTTASVQSFLRGFAAAASRVLPKIADSALPIIKPGDPAAASKLEAILKTHRVSSRIEVGDHGSSKTASIGCPYVIGSRSVEKPWNYLEALRTTGLQSLPDPTDDDKRTPLLYRLARLTMTRNIVGPIIDDILGTRVSSTLDRFLGADNRTLETFGLLNSNLFADSSSTLAAGSTLRGVNANVRRLLQRLNKNFVGSLKVLIEASNRPDGPAQLEMLMMEVLDFLQHRTDAIATGLAYARLLEQRKRAPVGLNAGYYGLLGKLRPQSITGSTDGYIQAPSERQATTTAILRSAALRYKENGAFDINLSSQRVRIATRLLDLIIRDLPLREALGLRGERWLHDQKASRLTVPLRLRFPIENTDSPTADDGPGPVQIRVFDGEKFIDGSLTSFPAADRPLLGQLKAHLVEELDAFSDLIVSEAVHQRVLGQSQVAKAWLQVLSGGAVPGPSDFIRTRRPSQGSTYRVNWLLQPTVPNDLQSPREKANPALAQLARRALTNFGSLSITADLRLSSDNTASTTVNLSLRDDLGMSEIDLVIGGTSELQMRIRYAVLQQWLSDPSLSNALLPVPRFGVNATANGQLELDIPIDAGSRIETALIKAQQMQALIGGSRAIEPGDLNAAALPASVLTESINSTLLRAALVELLSRCSGVLSDLQADIAAFRMHMTEFIGAARQAGHAIEADVSEADQINLLAIGELKRRSLTESLVDVSNYSEPGALIVTTIEEAAANPDGFEDQLLSLDTRLDRKCKSLQSAIGAAQTGATGENDPSEAIDQLTGALQAVLDGEGMRVPLVFPSDVTLTLQLGSAQSVDSTLGGWAERRQGTAAARDAANSVSGLRGFRTLDDATRDDTDPDDQDERDEAEAPRSRHFGLFIGDRNLVSGDNGFVGLVLDEWTEQRPSTIQPAALAINYDSPQTESPHCLLLGVPPNKNYRSWTARRACNLVLEVINLTKMRALSTDLKIAPASLFPLANQVPFKKGNPNKRRVPKRQFRMVDLGIVGAGSAEFVDADAAPSNATGIVNSTINERLGFTRREE